MKRVIARALFISAGPMVWTRPNQSVPIAEFERFQTDPAYEQTFVGLKFHPAMNQFPADSAVLDPYLELCTNYGLAAVFHSLELRRGTTTSRCAGRALPHGFFGPHHSTIDVVKESMTKGDADLCLGSAQADPSDVLAAVAELGIECVLFGSDAAFFEAGHYEQCEVMIDSLAEKLAPDEFRNVVRDNAIRVPARGTLGSTATRQPRQTRAYHENSVA